MRILISWDLEDVVCLQIERQFAREFATNLRKASSSSLMPFLTSTSGGRIEWSLTVDQFEIDVSKSAKLIRVAIPPAMLVELAEAIDEHADENGPYELDHSFETFGAKIQPAEIRDVVFETIPDAESE